MRVSYSLVVVRGLLTAVASLVAEHSLWRSWTSVVAAHELSSCGSQALEQRLNNCDTQAQLLHGMWDLLGPGMEPVSPALAGRFFTTEPPEKPKELFFSFSQPTPISNFYQSASPLRMLFSLPQPTPQNPIFPMRLS